MMNVDLQQLIRVLTTHTRRDLERAAERCVTRGGTQVLVEDMLLALLEHPQGLLVRALQDAGVEQGELQATLQPRVGRALHAIRCLRRCWCNGCSKRWWLPNWNWRNPRSVTQP